MKTTNTTQPFVFIPQQEWKKFFVGADDDFEQEVKTTATNRDLMILLADRQSDQKGISLEDVKKELGLL